MKNSEHFSCLITQEDTYKFVPNIKKCFTLLDSSVLEAVSSFLGCLSSRTP